MINDMIDSDNCFCIDANLVKLILVTNLKHSEIMLLGKIISLSQNADNACIASNAYLADVMCISERNISKYIAKIRKHGLIQTIEKKKGMLTTTRFIYPQYNTINKLIADADADNKEQ